MPSRKGSTVNYHEWWKACKREGVKNEMPVKTTWIAAGQTCIEEMRKTASHFRESVDDWMKLGDTASALESLLRAEGVELAIVHLKKLMEDQT